VVDNDYDDIVAIWTSTDGFGWRLLTGDAAKSLDGLSPAQLFATPFGWLAVTGGALCRSDDLASWEVVLPFGDPDREESTAWVYDIGVDERGLAAVGHVGEVPAAWFSSDGRAWQPMSVPVGRDPHAFTMEAVALADDRAIFVGWNRPDAGVWTASVR
jgi:hypothetical protein